MAKFEFWTLRTGAHAPERLTMDEIMIKEDGKVRAVIALDDDDGIDLHLSGNVNVRAPWLSDRDQANYE